MWVQKGALHASNITWKWREAPNQTSTLYIGPLGRVFLQALGFVVYLSAGAFVDVLLRH